jgi:aldehyde dehydrogenase (NAD+)
MENTHPSFKTIIDRERQFFKSGETHLLSFRILQLKKLKKLIETYEKDILLALEKDLGKSNIEAYTTEVLLTLEEIDLAIKKIKSWTRPTRVPTKIPLWPGRSYIYKRPYGVVLIVGAWNYPFLLIASPLVGAIAAGNCAIVKPSEIASHTQEVILHLINDHFPSDYLFAIHAGPDQSKALLQEKFDYIFFTGSKEIGQEVMCAAAKHLTPLTLELGGKSPCIVDETADLDFAARRIVWAKMTNAGQTCIAPDFLYIKQSIKEALLKKIKETLKHFYGDSPQESKSYARIINQKHFDRLTKLLNDGHILYGGKTDATELFIAPTLIDEITWQSPIMQDEIFGPLLPLLSYEHIDEVIDAINDKRGPLALYLFTNDKAVEQKVLEQVPFGGGCVNDCLLQFVNLHLPFGGIGLSGLGCYHGKHSFNTFSHQKSIYKKIWPIDFKLEYPPYNRKKFWFIKKLMQW